MAAILKTKCAGLFLAVMIVNILENYQKQDLYAPGIISVSATYVSRTMKGFSHKPKMFYRKYEAKKSLMITIKLLADDIELNPGPST